MDTKIKQLVNSIADYGFYVYGSTARKMYLDQPLIEDGKLTVSTIDVGSDIPIHAIDEIDELIINTGKELGIIIKRTHNPFTLRGCKRIGYSWNLKHQPRGYMDLPYNIEVSVTSYLNDESINNGVYLWEGEYYGAVTVGGIYYEFDPEIIRDYERRSIMIFNEEYRHKPYFSSRSIPKMLQRKMKDGGNVVVSQRGRLSISEHDH